MRGDRADEPTEKVKNAKPDLSVLKDYQKREEEFLRRAADLDEVTKLKNQKKAEYDELTNKRLKEFMAGFNAISLKLKEMYQASLRRLLVPNVADTEFMC